MKGYLMRARFSKAEVILVGRGGQGHVAAAGERLGAQVSRQP